MLRLCKLGRRIEWDADREAFVALPGVDFDAVLLGKERRGASLEIKM